MESTFNSVADWPIMVKSILEKISEGMVPLLQERRATPFLAEKFKRDVIKRMHDKGRFNHLKNIGQDVNVVFADYGIEEKPSLGEDGMPKTGDKSRNLKGKIRATRLIASGDRRLREIRISEQQQEYERQLQRNLIQLDGDFDDDQEESKNPDEDYLSSDHSADGYDAFIVQKGSKKNKRLKTENTIQEPEIMSSDSEDDEESDTELEAPQELPPEVPEFVPEIPLPYVTPLSSDEEEDDNPNISGVDHDFIQGCENLMLCQYDKIRRHKGRFKMYLTNGTAFLKGHDFVFQKANGEASMYGDVRVQQ